MEAGKSPKSIGLILNSVLVIFAHWFVGNEVIFETGNPVLKFG